MWENETTEPYMDKYKLIGGGEIDDIFTALIAFTKTFTLWASWDQAGLFVYRRINWDKSKIHQLALNFLSW